MEGVQGELAEMQLRLQQQQECTRQAEAAATLFHIKATQVSCELGIHAMHRHFSCCYCCYWFSCCKLHLIYAVELQPTENGCQSYTNCDSAHHDC